MSASADEGVEGSGRRWPNINCFGSKIIIWGVNNNMNHFVASYD